MLLMGMVKVALLLRQPAHPLKKVILLEEVIMGGSRHLSTRAQNTRWLHHSISIIKLLLWVVLPLLLLMVKVVWS